MKPSGTPTPAIGPYGPRTPLATLPRLWTAAGQGVAVARSAWDDPDAGLLFAHFPTDPAPELPVDHTVGYFGDLQVYARRAWTLTHPIAYMGRPISGEGCNVVLSCGWGSPQEFRGGLAQHRALHVPRAHLHDRGCRQVRGNELPHLGQERASCGVAR